MRIEPLICTVARYFLSFCYQGESMASVKVCQLTFRVCIVAGASLLLSTQCAAQSGTRVATPDPYFKPAVKKPDFSETYVSPNFSPGSIGQRTPARDASTSGHSVPWSHERSIVRDRSIGNNDFKPNKPKSKIVDSPDKIQLVSGSEPVTQQQEGVRVASVPKRKPATSLQHFEQSRVIAIVGGEPIFVGDMMFQVNQIIEAKIPQAPEHVKRTHRKKLLTLLTNQFVEQ